MEVAIRALIHEEDQSRRRYMKRFRHCVNFFSITSPNISRLTCGTQKYALVVSMLDHTSYAIPVLRLTNDARTNVITRRSTAYSYSTNRQMFLNR